MDGNVTEGVVTQDVTQGTTLLSTTDLLTGLIVLLVGTFIIWIVKKIGNNRVKIQEGIKSFFSKYFNRYYGHINKLIKYTLKRKTSKRLDVLEENVSSIEKLLFFNNANTVKLEPGTRFVFRIKGVEFAFRYCPPGEFMKTIPSDKVGDKTSVSQRRIIISKGFWIGETSITQKQWKGLQVPKKLPCKFTGTKLPVERVTWKESVKFVKELNGLRIAPIGWHFELPTEYQWEYACRAGTTGLDYGIPLENCAWYKDNSDERSHKVGMKAPNKWGIYDMLGNVWDWTRSPVKNNKDILHYAFCGGGYQSSAEDCTPSSNSDTEPKFCRDYLGFRVVLVPNQPSQSSIDSQSCYGIRKKDVAFESGLRFKSSPESWDGDFEAGIERSLEIWDVEFVFHWCPPGVYMMGTTEHEDGRLPEEKDSHEVRIDYGFWICETPTTQAQWDVLGYKKKEKSKNTGKNFPVENVSWNECDEFVKKINELDGIPDGWRFALPTEEQWEYACRAGSIGTTYGVDIKECAWYQNNSETKSHVVGMLKPNAWNIRDMLGNVWEWTSSKDEGEEGKTEYVFRGGSFHNPASLCRPGVRVFHEPNHIRDNIGFRLVLVSNREN